MTRIALRGLLARRLRLLLTGLSVALGVALIAGTYVFTDTINRSFDRIFDASYAGIDVAVTPKGEDASDIVDAPDLTPALLAAIRRTPGVERAEGAIFDEGTVFGSDGDRIGAGGAPNFIASRTVAEQFSATEVVKGRLPARDDEAAIDKMTADKEHFALGDTVRLQGDGAQRRYKLVGTTRVAGVDSFGGATVVLLTLPEAQRVHDTTGFDEIDVDAAPGTSPEALVSALRGVAGNEAEVRTGQQEAERQSSSIKEDLGFLRIALLAFAGISLFVGAFLIFNTFSITVAQRTREFGLLRMLGATRRQVLRSVLAEGLVIGLIGALVGLGAGVLIAGGLKALFNAVGLEVPASGTVLLARTIIVSLLVGTLVTLVASMAPAIRATRVPPVAALREDVTIEKRRSRVTPVAGALLGVLGVVLMAVGLFAVSEEGGALSLLGGGAAATFLGVGLLSPRLVPPLANVIGRPLRRRGIPGRLAQENSVRQPGRTAATASALMIGVALVGFASIFAGSAKQYIEDAIDNGSLAQAVVQNTDGWSSFTHQATEAVGKVPGVAVASPLRWVEADDADGETQSISGVDPASFPQVFATPWSEGSDATTWKRLGPGAALISKDEADKRGLGVGDAIRLQTPADRPVSLRIVGIHDDDAMLSDVVVANTTVASVWGTDKDAFVFVRYREGADPKQAIDTLLERQFPAVEALTNQEFIDLQADQLNQLLGLIYALLSLAIIVSLFGIVNTLVLAITERTRELGLLRAIGTSRKQVKRMIRYEAVIVASIGSVLGLALGIVLSILVTRAIDEFPLAIPFASLGVVLVLGALAGVLASILPARRAAKLDVLEALAYE